ncbi:FecR family protein [Sphingomonas sp. CJ99]
MTDEARLRREAADWLARLEGPDADLHRPAYARWRDAHPAHAAAMARLERHWAASHVLSDSALVNTNPLRPPWWRLPHGRTTLALGAAASIALVAAFAMRLTEPVATATRLASAVGELRALTLSDGTRVTLDTDSRIAVRFDGSSREIVLHRGRARFDVAADPRRFMVTVGDLVILDRGTVFDVRAERGQVQVALIEGDVEVAGRSPGQLARPVRLRPGQQVSLPGAGAATPSIGPAAGTAWTSGMLSFDGTPLVAVAAEANRYSRTPLVVADPAIVGLHVTGSFRAGEQAALADSLAAMFDLRLEPGPDGSIRLTGEPAKKSEAGGG